MLIFLPCAAALFAISILLSGGREEPSLGGAGAGVYSKSALGYAGVWDVMKRSGMKVSASTGNTAAEVGPRGTLIIGEPLMSLLGGTDDAVSRAERVLLILPKWGWTRDENHTAWVSQVEPMPLSTPQGILFYMAPEGGIVFRTEWPERWQVNEIGTDPSGSGVIQLIRDGDMRPLVGTPDGVLLGEIEREGTKLWVLSDPDIIANHGAHRGGNAAFIMSVAERLSLYDNDEPGRIVFDETVHGFIASGESPLGILFRFPFWVIAVMTVLAAGMTTAAGMGRFGPPAAKSSETDFGKTTLIDNGARLLDYGGHHAYVLKRYAAMTIRSAAKTLKAPEGMDEWQLVSWLDRIGESRGLKSSSGAILSAISEKSAGRGKLERMFALARDIHRWKGEILSGPSIHSRRG
jgi:hypothetical protein